MHANTLNLVATDLHRRDPRARGRQPIPLQGFHAGLIGPRSELFPKMPQQMKTEPQGLDSDLPELTSQQMEFVRRLLAGDTASDAYRAAYNTENMQASTVWAEASRLRSDHKVAAWLAAARKANLGSAVLTKEQHMQELERLREIALESGNIGAAVNAEVSRGKVAGHHVEKIQDVTDHGDVTRTLKEIEKVGGAEMAAAFAAEHGIAWGKPEHETAH